MPPPLLAALRPDGRPWQRQRVLLIVLAYMLPLLVLGSSGRWPAMALFGLGVFYMLLLDMGERRRERMENMLVGLACLLAGGAAGYLVSSASAPAWWLGVAGFVMLGAAFNAGLALEMHLRNIGLGYLFCKVPILLPVALLPWLLGGALWTIALSTLFAPRAHNPTPIPAAPFWRADWQRGRSGQFVGWLFGVVMMLAVLLSLVITSRLQLLHPAIPAMTTLMVLRPDHERTLLLVWQRVCGVLFASLLALAVFLLSHDVLVYAALSALAICLLPLAFASGMAWLAANATFLIMMLFGLLGLHGHEALVTIEYRALETLLGAVVAGLAGFAYLRLLAWRAGATD
ncbi:FUSC family protein [Chitinilyticum litopenaei]|uniref:FUSC family protein n=1 Tax=Chitinilyticum litopenaei TaxID=1121276 RepID=UPI00041F57BB|nr:FUSC family protein [Chitinilyticum litopenaei]